MSIRMLTRHRRILIMGLGRFGGGAGAARFWSDLGAEVTVTDEKDADALSDTVASLQDTTCRFVLGEHREEDFRACDVVVVNPAVRPDNRYLRLARNAGAQVLTEVGLVMRLARSPLLAVTGSNGKSTTTALLGAMLQAHDPRTLVGGNLGGSLLPAMKTREPSAPVVLELSSFQLHYLREQPIAPQIAVVTNLSPNHLDWHKTVLHYYEDKRTLVRGQEPTDWAILNAEDATLRAWAPECKARVVLTAVDDPGGPDACFLRDEQIVCRLHGTETVLAPLASLQLPGRHNRCNALQAAAAAFVSAKDAACIEAGLSIFTGLPHRLETVAGMDGRRFVNDSIATTPESTIRGLESFDAPVVLIAGGYDKGIPFDALGAAIVDHAHAVVLIGATAPAIRAAIEAAAQAAGRDAPPLHEAGTDFSQAVETAAHLCPPDGVVLLSPACASYDMFAHFQDRGDQFRVLAQRNASGLSCD